MVLVPGNLLRRNLILGSGPEAVETSSWWTSQSVCLSAEEACEDNLDPQLDQGNEEVIRVTLLTFDLKR